MQIAAIDNSMRTASRPPSAPGVYLFLAGHDNRIMYAGMAHDLEKVLYRYRKLDGRQKMRDRAQAGRIDRVAWVSCASGATPPSLEQLAIRRYRPPWNTHHNPNRRTEDNALPFTNEEQRWLVSSAETLDEHLAYLLSSNAPRTSGTRRPRAETRMRAAVIAILLGTFGIHKFYLGRVRIGVVYLLFFWTLIPTILGVIDGIRLATMSEATFDAKYG